ncbi:MAG: hypothetical protein C4537_00420 [Acholeplasma sp.]|jgi:hypothetical protein|nr:MAG: hypothetical protein C4537_00420 [Acholeplasma sp.]
MKSIDINVPRNLIKKFYRHPEPYGDGDYVVDLINGMYTDVFYREEGDFITTTNNNELISYLQNNQTKPREYFFRNGVFSLRHVQQIDYGYIKDWNDVSPISVKLDIPKEHNLPSKFMFCFYWIEVGMGSLKDNRLTLDIFEKELIHMIDIAVAIDLIIESLKHLSSDYQSS